MSAEIVPARVIQRPASCRCGGDMMHMLELTFDDGSQLQISLGCVCHHDPAAVIYDWFRK